MLYIASALSPTPILDTFRVSGLTSPDGSSLVIAKPDRVEVWDVDQYGLTQRAELALWGSVVGIHQVQIPEVKPHILVLLGPPNAHLLILSYRSEALPALSVVSSLPLSPPTPSLRQAEFFSGVISQGNVALVSLWVGVLSCIEIDLEKDKDSKRRRSSAAGVDAAPGPERKLTFKDNFNINIREHNLLHLAFLPPTAGQSEPVLSFLWLSSASTLLLQARRLSINSRSFNEMSKPIDVVMPHRPTEMSADTDFDDIPDSCPAARRVLPVSHEQMLVIGDEYTCLYSLSHHVQSPRVSRASISSSQGTATSPRAAATSRSPQNEMTAGTGKRRKSSMAQQRSAIGDRWDLSPVWRVRQGYGTVLAASVLEQTTNGASALLGDECGRLTALQWELEQGIGSPGSSRRGSATVQQITMGTSSPPSSLTYLGNSHLFLSSACGDSAVLQLATSISGGTSSPICSSTAGRAIPARKGKGRASQGDDEDSWQVTYESGQGSVTLKERWRNLAPVRDFDTVKEEDGGVSHLVVSSGVSNSNSLRVIRSGVGLEEVITVEGIEQITDLWNLSTSTRPLLIGSTSTSTFILETSPSIAPVAVHEKLRVQRTISASMLNGGVLQVRSGGATVWSDLEAGTSCAEWHAPTDNEVVAAHISGSLAVIGQRYGKVDILDASNGLQTVVTCQIDAEVSAVSIISLASLPSPIIAVATWTDEILVYTLDHLRTSSPTVTTLSGSFVASSLLIKSSTSPSASTSGVQLIAGLSDGSMVTYDLEPSGEDGQVVVKAERTSSLGTRPLRLCPVSGMSNGEENLIGIAISERLSVVFVSKDRIDFSTASRKDVMAAASIALPERGECLALATPTGISFTSVNSLKNLSVQTLDTGDRSIGKLISLTSQKLLACGTTSRTMDTKTGDVVQSSQLEIRDPTTLETLCEMALEDREEVICLQEVFLMGRFYIAVGTAIMSEEEGVEDIGYLGDSTLSAKTGRVLLLSPEHDAQADEWKASLIMSQETVGCVNDVAVIHGFLIIAAAGSVTVNRFSPNGPKLEELDKFTSTFLAQHLLVIPPTKLHSTSRLVIGDGMRSVCLLEVDEADGQFYPESRDMATHQVTALQNVKDRGEGCIIADGYSNLLTFRIDDLLEQAASFGLHEDVARIRQGSLVPPSSAPETMTPDLLFATSDGRIGIVGELTTGAAQTMDDLQRNMAKYHKGPGGIDWKTWRQGGTELVKKDTAGFVDGDFIQQFLDATLISPADSEKMLNGTNTHERVSKLGKDRKGREAADRVDVVRVLEAAGGLY